MAVRIIKIKPKPNLNPSSDGVSEHLSIEKFQWTNEENQQSGITTRALMFDWIVNKKGKAYVRKPDSTTVPIYGATSTGQQYIRSIENRKWTDELLSLDTITE